MSKMRCLRCLAELQPPYRASDGKTVLRDCNHCLVSYEVLDAETKAEFDRLTDIHEGRARARVGIPRGI